MKTLLNITNWPIESSDVQNHNDIVISDHILTKVFKAQVIILANNSLHSGLQRKTKYFQMQRSLTQQTPLEIEY